jgi:hypothetical protein
MHAEWQESLHSALIRQPGLLDDSLLPQHRQFFLTQA